MAEDRDDESRSPVLPSPDPGASPAEKPKAAVRLPTPPMGSATERLKAGARLPTPPMASVRISHVPSDPPRPSVPRLSFPEWFRSSIPPMPARLRRVVPRVRKSLLPIEDFVRRSVVPWVPRWRGWSPARTLTVTFGFGAFMFLLVWFTPRSVKRYLFARAAALVSPLHIFDEEPAAPEPPKADRADARLQRDHRGTAAGGILTVPPSFESADGKYDLIVHFHGNTDLVEESFAISKLDAVVVIYNLGNGSGPYEDRFGYGPAFHDMLERVDESMGRQGLREPKRRRLALTAWSAGYGAVARILDSPANADEVDAILLLDGIHASFLPDGSLDPLRIGPYARFARKAISNEKLFVITHSEIKPPDYPGTHATTDALLQVLSLTRTPGGTEPPFPALESNHGVPKSKIVPLKPLTEVHAGSFHVQGYSGETAEDHMAHLILMASTALPYLVKRWAPAGDAQRDE